MSRIRGKNTTPEITVRRLLHRMGYRFRLHVRIPVPDQVKHGEHEGHGAHRGKQEWLLQEGTKGTKSRTNKSSQRAREKIHSSKNPTIHSSERTPRVRFVRPDIVLPKYKTAIFVHGCFWHRMAPGAII